MTEEEIPTENNGKENSEKNGTDDKVVENEIIRQVEYYFSDANLPRDKFLCDQVKLDEGWVPFDILLKFNRLAKLSTDTEVIANAINNSTTGLLEVSDDNKKVRRNPELPIPEMNEEHRKQLMARTVYAKGFPKDSTLDDLLKFFKQHEVVENVIMRRYLERQTKKRHFKGSVFVTFKTKEQAEKFISTKDLKHNDTDLLTHWQEDYLKQKQEEYLSKKEKRDKKDKKNKEKADENTEKEELKLPTGTVFYFSLVMNDKMKREDIKDALTALGADVAYVDFTIGKTEGWVRLAKEDAAKEFDKKITDGKIKVGETEVLFRLLEGEEEKSYLDKSVEEIIKRRKNQKTFSKQYRGKNKGKFNRKRKQDQHSDEPPSKVKTDS